jgi:hypothetical protein
MTESFNEISELIKQYTGRISGDHHKSRDGYFFIRCAWYAWGNDLGPKFQADHPGYINKLEAPWRDPFDEAVEDLRNFLIEAIADYVPEDEVWQ